MAGAQGSGQITYNQITYNNETGVVAKYSGSRFTFAKFRAFDDYSLKISSRNVWQLKYM